MLLEAAGELGIDLTRSFMVGDRNSDVEAGRAAGCATVLIDLGYSVFRRKPAPDLIRGGRRFAAENASNATSIEPAPASPDYVVGSLAEAADVIIAATPTAQGAP